MNQFCEKGVKVFPRTDKFPGVTTGTFRRCQLEGCSGIRVGVKWGNNNITWPCSKSLELQPDSSFKIL